MGGALVATPLGKYMEQCMKMLTFIITCLFLHSCSESPTAINDNENNILKLSYTSADSSEAFDLALWAETKLIPSDSMVTKMLYSINYLRYCFKDSEEVKYCLALRFIPPWSTTSITIKFDDTTASQVRNKTYLGWSLLPDKAIPNYVESPDNLGWAEVRFVKPSNPWRMCEFYSQLPGIVICEPNFIGFAVIKTNPIYPRIQNGQMSYLFVYSEQYYFYYKNNKPIYAGIWSYEQNPKPSWWQDVKNSIDGFSRWGK